MPRFACGSVAVFVVFVAFAALAAGDARADEAQVGGGIMVLPVANLDQGRPGLPAVGAGAFFDYRIGVFTGGAVSIGLGPDLIVYRERGTDPAEWFTYLDLLARFAYEHRVVSSVEVVGYVRPGWSLHRGDKDSGFVLVLGGGVKLAVSASGFLTIDVGYRMGFQHATFEGQVYDEHARFLHIGLGVGWRL